MEKTLYLYRVTHPEHGQAQVEAIDRLRAIGRAAGTWGVPWTTIARECTCERLGPAPAPAPPKRKAGQRRPAKTGE